MNRYFTYIYILFGDGLFTNVFYMFVCAIIGEDPGLITVLKGKLARLTQRVPTLRIEHILTAMQEFVVGVPLVWLRLFRQVVKAVLVYIEVVEATEAEEAEEARV